MISKYDLFAFDMDGTLLDSMPYWRLCNIEFLLKHDLPYRHELAEDALFKSSRTMAERYIDTYGLDMAPAEAIGEYEALMLEHYEKGIKPKPGAARFLAELKRAGKTVCVATATSRPIAERALCRSGLIFNIDFVTDPRENGTSKADPAFFHALSGRTGVPVERICMVEDALYAIEGAKKAGCGVIAIEDLQSADDAPAIQAISDRYIRSFRELMEETL